MSRPLDIIIPTFDNPDYFDPCVESIFKTGSMANFARLIVVNNGTQPLNAPANNPALLVLEPKKNLGWEGGLDFALQHSDSQFVCFQNDDTLVPKISAGMYQRLVSLFADPSVGAVSRVTTTAAGWQSIYVENEPRTIVEVTFLIFFIGDPPTEVFGGDRGCGREVAGGR